MLWLIPTFGTRWTFYLLALLLLGVLSVGALRQPHRWAPLGALVLVLVLAFFTQPQGVRAAWDDGRTGTLIYEDESAFNYIAVREWGSERHLKLNDGIGIHSVYHPGALLSQGIWDYFLLAPLFGRGEGRGARGEEWQLLIVNCQLLMKNAPANLPISQSPISNLQSPISSSSAPRRGRCPASTRRSTAACRLRASNSTRRSWPSAVTTLGQRGPITRRSPRTGGAGWRSNRQTRPSTSSPWMPTGRPTSPFT